MAKPNYYSSPGHCCRPPFPGPHKYYSSPGTKNYMKKKNFALVLRFRKEGNRKGKPVSPDFVLTHLFEKKIQAGTLPSRTHDNLLKVACFLQRNCNLVNIT